MIKFTDPCAFKQFQELGQYLARTPADKRPPLSALVRNMHPEARNAAIQTLQTYAVAAENGGTTVPFGPRYSKDEVAGMLQVDPKLAAQIHQEEFDRDITVRLQKRLGTDADKPVPDEPLTLRDRVSAAFDAHVLGQEPETTSQASSPPSGSVRDALEQAASKYF